MPPGPIRLSGSRNRGDIPNRMMSADRSLQEIVNWSNRLCRSPLPPLRAESCPFTTKPVSMRDCSTFSIRAGSSGSATLSTRIGCSLITSPCRSRRLAGSLRGQTEAEPVAASLVTDLVAYQGAGTSYAGPSTGPDQGAILVEPTSWTGAIDVFGDFELSVLAAMISATTSDVVNLGILDSSSQTATWGSRTRRLGRAWRITTIC